MQRKTRALLVLTVLLLGTFGASAAQASYSCPSGSRFVPKPGGGGVCIDNETGDIVKTFPR